MQWKHTVNTSSEIDTSLKSVNYASNNRIKQKCLAYLAVSAPLVMRVLIRSSWPYRAAMCSGVFPFLSSQSISAPSGKSTEHVNDLSSVL